MAEERKSNLFGDEEDEETDDLFVSAIDTTPRGNSSNRNSTLKDSSLDGETNLSATKMNTSGGGVSDSDTESSKRNTSGLLAHDDGEEINLNDDEEPENRPSNVISGSQENGLSSSSTGPAVSSSQPGVGVSVPAQSATAAPVSSGRATLQTSSSIHVGPQMAEPTGNSQLSAGVLGATQASGLAGSAPITAAPQRTTLRSAENTNGENGSGDHAIEIKVSDPQKIGDGMSSYMTYRVVTKTNLPYFRRQSLAVARRFSDFLGLRDRLAEKHLNSGRIVPPSPEKSAVGMVQVKMSKEDTAQQADFIEKRRATLERFINRVAAHPVLRTDPDFREFLELETDLPRASGTSALSGAGVKRFLFKMGDSVNKMTFRMDESDPWFDDKLHQVESLDQQLRKLLASVEALIHHRRELVSSTGAFSKGAAMLGNCEEHTGLSCALSQLAETEERLEQIYADQATHDFIYLGELIRDYIALIGSVREVFNQRVKVFQSWIHAQQMLTKKREQKNRFELAHRTDKIGLANEECIEWESKVKRGQEEFENISKNIKTEVERFELQRITDFKTSIIKYMESLLDTQQQIITTWEKFLPEVKSIV